MAVGLNLPYILDPSGPLHVMYTVRIVTGTEAAPTAAGEFISSIYVSPDPEFHPSDARIADLPNQIGVRFGLDLISSVHFKNTRVVSQEVFCDQKPRRELSGAQI